MKHIRPRRLITAAVLIVAWCGLWGSFTVANLVSGTVVAVAVLATGVGTAGRGTVRLVPLLKLFGLVLVDLVKSTASVATEILTPTDRTDESIIGVEVPRHGNEHFLLLVVAITLTPGTAVVDADPDTGTLYLHLLHHKEAAETTKHVQRIATLACEALPLRSSDALTSTPRKVKS